MSTMTRHRAPHTGQQIALFAAAGVLAAGDAAGIGDWAIHTRNGAAGLATVVLGAAAGMLLLTAAAWTASLGWHHGRHRYLVHAAAYTPLRRPLYPLNPVTQPVLPPDPAATMNNATRADHWADWAGSGPIGPRPFVPPVSAAAATTGTAQ